MAPKPQSYIFTPQGTADATAATTPQDRTFRDAWQLDGQDVIDVDMTKAREIWRDKIRTARKSKLEKLDAEFMKALEDGNTPLQTSLAAQKQALRDAPADPAIETAQTPEDLKAVQPAGLTIS